MSADASLARRNDDPAAAATVADYLAAQENKDLLRFLTCGSVDDGKSTLIGRLLYDTKLIFEDQLSSLARDSARHGTTGDDIDLALLVDGLEAEREQGITIDVAYRFFATARRKFIVADTPGHEQYTRNMATGASTADLAIVLVDARQGVLTQTRRHSFIASLLGIRNIVLAVNKIDLVDFSEAAFGAIRDDYLAFAKDLSFASIAAIPISARFGDNVTTRSGRTPWFDGPSLLDHLESVDVSRVDLERPFRFPVQYVSRPDLDFRGFAGEIASGRIAAGDPVVIARTGLQSHVKRIVTMDGDLDRAIEGQAVTFVLADEVDCSRGDMLVAPGEAPSVADRFAARIVWFGEAPLRPGRSYILRTETQQTTATVSELKYQIDVNSFAHLPAASLEMNGIGLCDVATQMPIAFDPYRENRATGSFVVIDRMTNATVGAGMIEHALGPAASQIWQTVDVDRSARAALKRQTPRILWFTGLSGAGKTTLATMLEKRLHAAGRHTYLLDGNALRHHINRDLGFSDAERLEHVRRVAEVARLMAEAGLIVIVSLISPFAAQRQLARELAGDVEFLEIFVDTPFEECVRRDRSILYRRALAGEIRDFTGAGPRYEPPEKAELHLRTLNRSPDELTDAVWTLVEGGRERP